MLFKNKLLYYLLSQLRWVIFDATDFLSYSDTEWNSGWYQEHWSNTDTMCNYTWCVSNVKNVFFKSEPQTE